MDLEGMQELQQVDLLRDDARRKLEAIEAQIGPPPFAEALDAEIAAQADVVQQAEASLREARAAVEAAERRIEATDKRIYDGTITDHRTLQDLQADLYKQRQDITPLRQKSLAAEQDHAAGAEAEVWLGELRGTALASWQERQTELSAQRDQVNEQIGGLSVQVDAKRKHLAGEDLVTYDSYRLRGPRVVASVAGGVCGECRLMLPRMVITRARRADRPVECPSCGCLVRVS